MNTYQSYPHVIEELQECIKNLKENTTGCEGQELEAFNLEIEEFKSAVNVLKKEQRISLKKMCE